MLPRPFRLMASSPKRVLVPPNKRALSYPDISLSIPDGSATDAFGPDWPPKRMSGDGGAADSSPRSKDILKCITSQPSALLSRPTVSTQPLSKIILSASKLDLDPPVVHPLRAYSYKDHDPLPSRIYLHREEEANKLVGKLSGPVGFDIEWKVIFRKGAKTRPAATVQLGDQGTILVIQISAMKAFPTKLKELLEDADVAKVGVNILNDGNKLARDYGVRPQGLVELGGLARQADVHYVERYFRAFDAILKATNLGSTSDSKKCNPRAKIDLATITTMYTGRTLCKGPVRISDWEVQPLTEAQLEYAANDAHSALIVYQRLIEIAKKTNVVLNPRKYTCGVRADYRRPSETKTRSESRGRTSVLQAPALTATSSTSSSTSTSTWMSGDDSIKGWSISTSTSSSTSGTHSSGGVKCVFSTSQGTNPAFRGLPVNARKTDIGSLKTAECHKTSHSVSRMTCVSMEKTDEQATRGRPGPRFKPSYNNFPRPKPELSISSTNEVISSSPMRMTKTSAPNNSSLERSGRFKPSYNTTMSGFTREKIPADTSSPARSSSALSSVSTQPLAHQPISQKPQHIRAYNLWHIRQFPLPEICRALRSRDNPLKAGTVITYVVGALQADPRLPFSQDRLKALLASEPSSWLYYRGWFHTLNVKKYINMDVGTGIKDVT